MNRRHGTEGGAGRHGQTAASEVHQQHPVLHTPRDQQVTHRIFEDEQDHPGKTSLIYVESWKTWKRYVENDGKTRSGYDVG